MKKIIYLVSLVFFGFTQNTYVGKIIDSDTKEALAGVNVYIEENYEGTATDINGEFRFITFETNPKVTISYVGYKTRTARLTNGLTIKLDALAITSETVLVVADGYTRAQRIILNTMDNYEKHFDKVENFKLDVYSKTFFYFPKTDKDKHKDDSLRNIGKEDEINRRIPWLFESLKEVSWEKPNKIYQIITKRNQGKAIPGMFNLMGVVEYQNIFNERYMNFDSPLYRNFFEDFNYQYGGKEKVKNDSCYIIYATKIDSSDSFKYKLTIEDQGHFLKKVEVAYEPMGKDNSLRITPFMRIRDGKNVSYIQDYEQNEKITFPKNFILSRVNDRGVVRMAENYQNRNFNLENLKVKYTDKIFNVHKDADIVDSLLWKRVRPKPLAPLELRAFTDSDSLYQTYDAWDRFMLSHGIRFILFDYYIYDQKMTSSGDFYRFNPVEGNYFGVGFLNKEIDNVEIEYRLGYAEAMKTWNGDARINFPLSYDYDINVDLSIYHRIRPIAYEDYFATFNGLFEHKNRYHYLRETGMTLRFDKPITNDFSLALSYQNKRNFGVENNSEFSLNNENLYQANYHIIDSKEYEIGLHLSYDEYIKMDLGSFKINQLRNNGWDLDLDLFFNANDFGKMSFKRFEFDVDKQFKFTRYLEMNMNAHIYYSKADELMQNAYYGKIVDFYIPNQEYAISSFSHYNLLSYDFQSISSRFLIRDFFDPIGLDFLGNLTLFATAYRSTAKGNLKDPNFKELDTKLDYNLGVNIMNTLLFIPLKFSYHYNTFNKSNTYSISSGINF